MEIVSVYPQFLSLFKLGPANVSSQYDVLGEQYHVTSGTYACLGRTAFDMSLSVSLSTRTAQSRSLFSIPASYETIDGPSCPEREFGEWTSSTLTRGRLDKHGFKDLSPAICA